MARKQTRAKQNAVRKKKRKQQRTLPRENGHRVTWSELLGFKVDHDLSDDSDIDDANRAQEADKNIPVSRQFDLEGKDRGSNLAPSTTSANPTETNDEPSNSRGSTQTRTVSPEHSNNGTTAQIETKTNDSKHSLPSNDNNGCWSPSAAVPDNIISEKIQSDVAAKPKNLPEELSMKCKDDQQQPEEGKRIGLETGTKMKAESTSPGGDKLSNSKSAAARTAGDDASVVVIDDSDDDVVVIDSDSDSDIECWTNEDKATLSTENPTESNSKELQAINAGGANQILRNKKGTSASISRDGLPETTKRSGVATSTFVRLVPYSTAFRYSTAIPFHPRRMPSPYSRHTVGPMMGHTHFLYPYAYGYPNTPNHYPYLPLPYSSHQNISVSQRKVAPQVERTPLQKDSDSLTANPCTKAEHKKYGDPMFDVSTGIEYTESISKNDDVPEDIYVNSNEDRNKVDYVAPTTIALESETDKKKRTSDQVDALQELMKAVKKKRTSNIAAPNKAKKDKPGIINGSSNSKKVGQVYCSVSEGIRTGWSQRPVNYGKHGRLPLPKCHGCKKQIGRSERCLRFKYQANAMHKHPTIEQYHCTAFCLIKANKNVLEQLIEKPWTDTDVANIVKAVAKET